MITLPIRGAQELLHGYIGEEVTITPDDEYLLKYAQGLHTKCDELGKERDELGDDANFWHREWEDEHRIHRNVEDELCKERDQARDERAHAIATYKRILTEERVKWEQSIDKLREGLEGERDELQAQLMGPWEYEDMTRRIMTLERQRDEFQLAWNSAVAELGMSTDTYNEALDRLEGERDDYFQRWADNQSFTQRLSHERDAMEATALDTIHKLEEAREWARYYKAKLNLSYVQSHAEGYLDSALDHVDHAREYHDEVFELED